MSLNTYILLEAKQKLINDMQAISKLLGVKNCKPNNNGKNKNKFFTQWFGLINLTYFIIIFPSVSSAICVNYAVPG